MNKLTRIISEMDAQELRILKADIEKGTAASLINEKIRQIEEQDPNKVCPVCQSAINESSLCLVFGPEGLRKKASFCAVDCLEYFLSKIKQRVE